MRPLKDPAEIEPLGERILVKPYQMPEMTASGLYIPDPYRKHRSLHYYEYVKASPEALDKLGFEPHVGAIIKTRFKMPADTGFDDPNDGSALLFLLVEEVEGWMLWA